MSLRSAYFTVDSLHKQRHLFAFVPVFFSKHLDHSIDTTFDILHALMLINIVQFHLCLHLIILSLFLLLLNFDNVFLANEFLQFLVLALSGLVELALEDHGGVEAFIG